MLGQKQHQMELGVLEQALVGGDCGQLLCILSYRDLLVRMSKVQLGESFTVRQRGKNVFNARQRVGVGLGDCSHGQFIIATDPNGVVSLYHWHYCGCPVRKGHRIMPALANVRVQSLL